MYKEPRQGAEHMLSVHSGGCFSPCRHCHPSSRQVWRALWAELCPFQNTCVLTAGPLGCGYI